MITDQSDSNNKKISRKNVKRQACEIQLNPQPLPPKSNRKIQADQLERRSTK
ncbi:hypothetical protein [Shimazuella kribbensis]|uniref:hypothetical protein n=1 Tax=Shimazuella kribbensis TaxID=139808 RepID=UPI0004222BED|nr:hypothetical protein [Shimazuella kribbensis]